MLHGWLLSVECSFIVEMIVYLMSANLFLVEVTLLTVRQNDPQ